MVPETITTERVFYFFQIIQIWSRTKREWNILLHYMVF